MPSPIKNYVIPICETEEEKNCIMSNIFWNVWSKITNMKTCPKSCSTINYSGKVTYVHKFTDEKELYQVGMFSHKMSLLTIFGQNYLKSKNVSKN